MPNALPETNGEEVNELQALDPVVTAQAEQRFTEFVDQLFEESTTSEFPPRVDPFELQRVVIAMAPLTGEDEELLDAGRITPKFRNITQLFFEALLRKVAEERKDETEAGQQKLRAFLGYVQETFFSYSPNLTQYLGITNQFTLGARATRIPEAQGWFGGTMVGELVYSLRFADESIVDDMVQELEGASLPDVLDFIHFAQTVAADAIANGSWAYEAVDRMRLILERIRETHPAALVQYEATLTLKRIDQEEENPSLSVLKQHGDPREGRLIEGMDEEMVQESERLSHQIAPGTTMRSNERPLQVSRDAIALFDHSTLPRKFTLVDVDQLPEPQCANTNSIRALQSAVEHDGASFDTLLDSHRVLQEAGVIESTADWNQLVPEVSAEDWSQFFSYAQGIRERSLAVNRQQRQLEQEAGDACERKADEFLQHVDSVIDRLEPAMQEAQALPQEYIDEFRTYLSQGNAERAFDAAEHIVQFFEIREEIQRQVFNGQAGNVISELRERFAQLRNDHIAIWQEVQEHMQQIIDDARTASAEEKMLTMLVFQKLQKNAEAVTGGLLRTLDTTRAQAEEHLTPVTFHPYEEIPEQYQLNPFSQSTTEDIPLLLQHLHRPEMRRLIEQDLGIEFTELSLQSQMHLLRFLQDKDSRTFTRLRAVLQNNPRSQEILESFLACSEDRELGHIILDIAEQENTGSVFEAYAHITRNAEESAQALCDAHKKMVPESSLNPADFYRGLVSRANDLLQEAYHYIFYGEEWGYEALENLLRSLEKENARITASRSFFVSLTSALNKGQNVDLRAYADTQKFVLHALEEAGAKPALLRTLQSKGFLSPIPEIHWRVDRTAKEYDRRFGLDVTQMLRDFSSEDREQLLLEFGPGNGTFREELQTGEGGEKYLNVALANKIYYPLGPVIERLIDFARLEQDIGAELTPDERKLLSEFLYKILVIKEGETELDEFHYDQEVQQATAEDAAEVLPLLARKASLLANTNTIPQTISTRHTDPAKKGQVIYPYKIHKSEQSPAFQKACSALSYNLQTYLREGISKEDIYELIPAYAPGTIIGDFGAVRNMSDKQIDVALGVRSTLYLRGEQYINFMKEMGQKLSGDGIYIDDNVRDNDGWYYRLAELLKAREGMDPACKIGIITGPGFPSEDFSKDQRGVPLAVVVTKDEQKWQYIQEHMIPSEQPDIPAFELKSLDDILQDRDYLLTLDNSGEVARTVDEALNQT